MATPIFSKMISLRSNLSASRTQKLISSFQSSVTNSTRSTHSTSTSCLEQCTAFRSSLWRSTRQSKQTAQCQRRASSAMPSISATQIRTAASKSAPASSTTAPSQLLTWNQFLVVRRRKRFFNTGVSIVCAVAAAIIGAPLIGEYGIDAKVSELLGGADTIAVLAIGSISIAVGGWFAGRVLGASLFQLFASSRGWSKIYAEKEKSLFDRIKRYRADPASSSPQNPVPDYYGEKIASVANYRTWLKDQRAFTKKMYRGVR